MKKANHLTKPKRFHFGLISVEQTAVLTMPLVNPEKLVSLQHNADGVRNVGRLSVNLQKKRLIDG